MREIVLDTETTGLDPLEGDRVVEIGAVEIVHKSPTGNVFHQLINPEREVPEDAVRVHGHTETALRDKPVFAEVAGRLLSFIGEARLVIHNAEFDVGFLNSELARIGQKPIEMHRVIDTLALARKKHPGLPNNLDALCDRYHIRRPPRVKHGALLDAKILVEVYMELTGGRQHSLVFGEVRRNHRMIQIVSSPLAGPRTPRVQPIELCELSAHIDYVRTLGEEAIWLHFSRMHPGRNAQ